MGKCQTFLLKLGFSCLTLLGSLLAFASEPPTAARSVAELESRIENILSEYQIPGMIGAIVYGEEVIWQGALGLADQEKHRPVTHETLFRVGSISKTFVSLSILKLVERGELRLSDLISELAPKAGVVNKWNPKHPVRLVHVLEHTAGFDDIHLRDYAWNAPDATTREGIDFNTTSRHARWEPGTRMSYSNIGPPIAALVLENKTGQRYEDFVQKELFDALGMQTATFFYDPAVSRSYDLNDHPVPYHHLGVRSSGALNATSGDMIQLLRLFNNRGKLKDLQLFQPQSLNRMESPHSTLAAQNGLQIGYGLGNYTTQMKGFVFQGHGGAVTGFLSKFAYLPHERRGYFFSINKGNMTVVNLIEAEITAFLCRGLQAPEPTPKIELDERELNAYAGLYEADAPRSAIFGAFQRLMVLRVQPQNGKLRMGPVLNTPRDLAPVGHHQFIRDGHALPSLIFFKGPNGAQMAEYQGVSLSKVSPFVAYGRLLAILVSLVILLSTILWAPFWLVRWVSGDEQVNRTLSIRTLPFLGSTVLWMGGYLFFAGTAAGAMAEPTFYSVGFWLCSLAFAGMTSLTLVYTLLQFGERHEIGLLTWLHAFCAAVSLFVIHLFLSQAGFIGLQTWAY